MTKTKKRKPQRIQKLVMDLHDIDGRIIAREGSVVNRALIREVIDKGVPLQNKSILLNKPEILITARKVMAEKIYHHIFPSVSLQKKILHIIKKSRIQSNLYREILKLKKISYFTYRHSVLMGVLATKMAMDLKSYGYRAQDAFVLALTHDIGKTRLPIRTLNKKTPLTSNEYRVLHSYPNFSMLLLYYYLGRHSEEAVRVAYEHHEKLDGSGYPKGIRSLSKYTRIVSIIDIFDAMVAKRPYRKRGFTVRGALDKLIAEMYAEKLPKLAIRLLISYFRRGEHNFRTMKISMIPRDEDPLGNYYGTIAGK